jgi:imidazolonepropionase-like amidohydrolase
MKTLRPLTLTTIAFLFYLTASGQLISKKESAAIDKILTESSEQFKPKTYIIQNVSVLTMKDSELIKNQSVLIENGIIQKIGTDIQNQNATIIDGTGKFLMPGLTDMHVHLFDRRPGDRQPHPLKNTWMMLLLINGVTSVRDMCGEPGKLQLRDKIRRNEILAPNLYQSGPIINGVKDNSGLFAYASSPEQGREIVIGQKKLGYDFIKVYDGLTKEVYEAIADEAQKQGMLVDGHLPDQITLEDAIKSKHNSVEHLTGYFEWRDHQVSISAPDNYAPLTANSGLWNCPTIYNHYMQGSRNGVSEMFSYAETSGLVPSAWTEMWKKRISNNSKETMEIVDKFGESNFETLKKIVLNLYNSKAKLIAGTDAGNLPLLIPGYSLHQELKIMSEIGIPNYEVLKMTTINAALAMNKETEFGTIEVGKRADLLLLNSNPLDKIENLQDKNGLMVRGIWLSEEEIKKLTDKVKLAFGK